MIISIEVVEEGCFGGEWIETLWGGLLHVVYHACTVAKRSVGLAFGELMIRLSKSCFL